MDVNLELGTDWIGEDGSWSFTRFSIPPCFKCSVVCGTDSKGNEIVFPSRMVLSPDGNSATCTGCKRTLYKQPNSKAPLA
jgi:hypothetical protein